MSAVHVTVSATAWPQGEDLASLTIDLRNGTAEDLQLSFNEPFTAFEVLASTQEGPVAVHQPPLDIPVQATSITLPAGGTVSLQTPVRLRITEGAEAGSDGWVWTVPRRRDAVSLQVRLLLPALFGATCPIDFVE